MKNTFGTVVSVTLFGESHGAAVGAVCDGLAPGIPVDEAYIAHRLMMRRGVAGLSTARREPDAFSIVSGVYRGFTTGSPLCVMIPNTDADPVEYEKTAGVLRPGHADYTALEKYHGFADMRGGGHFSGRLNAPLVAVGAIVMQELERSGVRIGTHLLSCGGIEDRAFDDYEKDIALLYDAAFPVLDTDAGDRMADVIRAAAANGDSVGGVMQTAVVGLPVGVGEPWFDTAEGCLAKAMFSIPAVKGVSFGDGFALAAMTGSQANDPFVLSNGQVKTASNRNGGINGGITNGMPLLMQCAVKPTPSIAQEQTTVDMRTKKQVTLSVSGRHDPAIAPRACAVADAMTALTLYDLMRLKG